MRPLTAYYRLRSRITAQAQRLAATYAAHLSCRRGCWYCCDEITVLPVEVEAARLWIARRQATKHDHLKPAAQPAPDEPLAIHNAPTRIPSVDRSADGTFPDVGTGARCAFLDATGACAIYEARPVICRTHGLPLAYRVYEYDAEGVEVRPDEPQYTDLWCDLNFTALDSDSAVACFDRHGRIIMATVNEELELINKAFLGTPAGQRYAREQNSRFSLSVLRPDSD